MLERPGPAVRIGDTRVWLCRFRRAQGLVPLPAGQLSASPTTRHLPSGKTFRREPSKAGSHEKSPPSRIEAEQTFLIPPRRQGPLEVACFTCRRAHACLRAESALG